MNKFLQWFAQHHTEFTWFLIGWLAWGGIDALSRGHYFIALLDAGIGYMNYALWKNQND